MHSAFRTPHSALVALSGLDLVPSVSSVLEKYKRWTIQNGLRLRKILLTETCKFSTFYLRYQLSLLERTDNQLGSRFLRIAYPTATETKKMKMILKGALGFTALSLLMPCHICAQAAGATNQPTAAELKPLQGTWEGVLVGQESAGKIIITFTGNSLRFQGLNTNEWYEATFTLPTETNPQQLRATITGCPRTNDIGTVVGAIFKIEDGALTLAGIQDRDQEPPKSFGDDKPLSKIADGPFTLSGSVPGVLDGAKAFEDNTLFRYELRKVQKMNSKP
jgi:uncharacterized protein (TIGR03067 family)